MCSSTRGPAMAPALGHVAHDKNGYIECLGQVQQGSGAFAHLGDAAGRGSNALDVDRLDRIDDGQDRVQRLDLLLDPFQIGLGQDIQMRRKRTQPLSAHLDLLGDSSPDMYRTGCHPWLIKPATWRSSVDLPMPGSPPMSTSEPGTSPPPNTRLNSPIGIVMRWWELLSISVIGLAWLNASADR